MKNNYDINNSVNAAINELSGIQLKPSQEGGKVRSSPKNYMRNEDGNKILAIVDSFVELQHQRGYPVMPDSILQRIVKEQLKKHKVIAIPTFWQRRRGEDNHKLRNLEKFSEGFAEAYKNAQNLPGYLAKSYDSVEQLIEAWRFELIETNRQAFAKKIVEKVGKGEFPGAYKDIEEGIRANAEGTRPDTFINQKKIKFSQEEAIKYTDNLQKKVIKTINSRDIGTSITLNLFNKLNVNVLYPEQDGRLDQEKKLALKFFTDNGVKSKDADKAINKYPALRALCATTVENTLSVDMSHIQKYGSALAKRDKDFFIKWQEGLKLVEEAQKDIVELLKKSKGVITQNVEKKLAEYNIKALEYLKYQIEKTPGVVQVADSRVITKKGKSISERYVKSETVQFGKGDSKDKLSKEKALEELETKITGKLLSLKKPQEQKQEEKKQVKKPEKKRKNILPNSNVNWNKEASRLGIPEITREVFNEFIGWKEEKKREGKDSSLKLFAKFKQSEKAVEILGSKENFNKEFEWHKKYIDPTKSPAAFASNVIKEFKSWQQEANKLGVPDTTELYRGFKSWQQQAGRNGKEPSLDNFKKAFKQFQYKERNRFLPEEEIPSDNRNRSLTARREVRQRLHNINKGTQIGRDKPKKKVTFADEVQNNGKSGLQL